MNTIISYHSRGDYSKDLDRIADITAVEAIPYIVIRDIENDYNEFPTILYYFPNIHNTYTTRGSSAVILENLLTRKTLCKVPYVFKGTKYELLVGKGCIMTCTGQLLLVLGYQTKFLSEDYLSEWSSSGFFPEYSSSVSVYKEMILYLSTDFYLVPEFEAFLKKIQKDYINVCYMKGVETKIVSSQEIEKNTFANNFRLEFSTIRELDYNLKNEVKFLLNKPIDYFMNHPLFVKNTIPEVISVDERSYAYEGDDFWEASSPDLLDHPEEQNLTQTENPTLDSVYQPDVVNTSYGEDAIE